jgi:hypothetical protein
MCSIATLNVTFPDHEFSDVKPAHFRKKQSDVSAVHALSTTLVAPREPIHHTRLPPTNAACDKGESKGRYLNKPWYVLA